MRKGCRKKVLAFTLIELLIVVAIIAILAAIAVPNFLEAQTRSKVSRIKADMRSISVGMEAYKIDNPRYPPDYVSCASGWAKWVHKINTGNGPDMFFTRWALCPLTTPVAYMSTLPATAFETKGSAHSNGGSFAYDFKNHGPEYSTSDYNPKPLSLANPGFPFFCIPETGWTPYRKWRLRDVGPDMWQNNQETPKEPYYYCIYDPTNGTVSNGDIVRWGP